MCVMLAVYLERASVVSVDIPVLTKVFCSILNSSMILFLNARSMLAWDTLYR